MQRKVLVKILVLISLFNLTSSLTAEELTHHDAAGVSGGEIELRVIKNNSHLLIASSSNLSSSFEQYKQIVLLPVTVSAPGYLVPGRSSEKAQQQLARRFNKIFRKKPQQVSQLAVVSETDSEVKALMLKPYLDQFSAHQKDWNIRTNRGQISIAKPSGRLTLEVFDANSGKVLGIIKSQKYIEYAGTDTPNGLNVLVRKFARHWTRSLDQQLAMLVTAPVASMQE